MEKIMERFLVYLQNEKQAAKNTIEAYRRDIKEFFSFAGEKGISEPGQVSQTDIVSYLLRLKNSGKSPSTVNRRVASLRAFFTYMHSEGIIKENPVFEIKSPKVERKELEYLSIEEVDRLLSLPDTSPKGIRDKAILEVLYATGIRVSELVEANLEDVNTRMGFITCHGNGQGKPRIVPMGRPARAAMEEYIYDVRPKFALTSGEENALFLNYKGERISRQGLWKLIREYAADAGLENHITPQVLRNSFAVHMIQNGADLKSLQELLGHEDLAATQIYLSVTKNRIKEVYDKTHPRA